MDDSTTDQLYILKDVKRIHAGDNKAVTVTVKEQGFPLFLNSRGSVISAASKYGSSRIVVTGLYSCSNSLNACADGDDSHIFISNIARWLTPGKEKPRVGIFTSGDTGALVTINEVKTTVLTSTKDFKNADCIFIEENTCIRGNDCSAIKNFMKDGGGISIFGKCCIDNPELVRDLLVETGISINSGCFEDIKEYRMSMVKPSSSIDTLLNGIQSINLGSGTPSKIVVFGESAFSILQDVNASTIIAGSHFHRGRVVHYGHKKYLQNKRDFSKLNANVLWWLTTKHDKKKTVGLLGSRFDFAKSILKEFGYNVKLASLDDDFGDLSAIIVTCQVKYLPEQLRKLQKFVADGGGLLSTGHNWYYKNDWVSDMCKLFGIYVTEMTGENGEITISRMSSETRHLFNASKAMQSVIQHSNGEVVLGMDAQLVALDSIRTAHQALPYPTNPYHELTNDYLNCSLPVIPSQENPVKVKLTPLDVLYINLSSTSSTTSSPSDNLPHPAAATFPGLVPSHLRPLRKTLMINATFTGLPTQFKSNTVPVWRSTGLYAAPGSLITATVPPECIDKGLQLLIGCHTDKLHRKEDLWRYPSISRTFNLSASNNLASNAFGGLMYVLVPKDSQLGNIEVTIDGGYRSPEYIHGETTKDEWRTTVAENPVPFCELRASNIILTVPTADAQAEVHDPEALMQIYHDSVEGMFVLSGIDPVRAREERFVLDVQITAGIFHAGYPIMGHTRSAKGMLNVDTIKENGIWAPLHELGHQMQSSGWNFQGTKEATCNIYSVYCSENILGLPRHVAHRALQPEKRKSRIDAYVSGGRDFNKSWKVWTCLETYLQLQEAFGWQFFQDMLTFYNQVPSPIPQRASFNDLVDKWMITSSELTGFNLGPFYVAWGWPVSHDALEKVGALPRWVNNPMAARE